MLPLAFCERMRRMLGQAEYEAFLKSYDEDKYQGLRFNIEREKQEDFLALAEEAFSLEKIRGQSRILLRCGGCTGPSMLTMRRVSIICRSRVLWHRRLICKPDRVSRVLDLCAAPGGKTTQIAAQMQRGRTARGQ